MPDPTPPPLGENTEDALHVDAKKGQQRRSVLYTVWHFRAHEKRKDLENWDALRISAGVHTLAIVTLIIYGDNGNE